MPANRIAAWLAAALSCSTLPVCAEQALGNDALRAEVNGSTVHIDAPLGYKIPMQFREDGSVHGTAGGLAFYLGSAADQGRWWIANGKLCTRWKQWFDQEDNCITIRRQGRDEFAWVNDKGKSGTGRVVERRPVTVASAGVAAGKPAAGADPAGWGAGAHVGRETRAVPARGAGGAADAKSPEVQPQAKMAAILQPQSPAASQLKAASPPPKKTADSSIPRAGLGGPVSKESGASAAPEKQRAAEPKSIAAKGADAPERQVRTAPPAAAVPKASKMVTRPEPQRVFRVVNVDDDDELFVRAQPNSGAPIVGAIPPDGRGVRALGPCQNSWCPVSFQGRAGWAHGAYLVAESD